MKDFTKGGMIHGVSGMYGGADLPLQRNEELTFGRGAEFCHIVIADDTGKISRKHASVSMDSRTGDYVVTDFSSNGTFLGNGTRLLPNTPTRLPPGTTIYLADPENCFLLGEPYVPRAEAGGQFAEDVDLSFSPGLAAGSAGAEGFLDRYEDGGMTLFVCLAGIVTAVVALLTFSQNWVSVNLLLYHGQLTLPQVSHLSSIIGGVTRYFDSGTASMYGLISIAADVSYWILLIGGILALAVSAAILIWPKAEIVIFIPAYTTIAFAIIGAVFTIVPLLTNGLGFMPIPLVMLIVAGIPAAVIRFIF